MGVVKNTVRGIGRAFKPIVRIAAPVVGGISGGPIGAMIGGAIGGAVQGGNRGDILKNAVIGGATSYFGAKWGAEMFAPETAGATAAGAAVEEAAKTETLGSIITSKVVSAVGQQAATQIGTSLGIIGANLAAQKIAEGFQPPMPPAFSNGEEISQGTPLPSFDQLQKESANKVQVEMNKSLNSGFRLRNPINRPFFMGPPKNLSGEIPFEIRRKQKTQKELARERYKKWRQTTRIK